MLPALATVDERRKTMSPRRRARRLRTREHADGLAVSLSWMFAAYALVQLAVNHLVTEMFVRATRVRGSLCANELRKSKNGASDDARASLLHV